LAARKEISGTMHPTPRRAYQWPFHHSKGKFSTAQSSGSQSLHNEILLHDFWQPLESWRKSCEEMPAFNEYLFYFH